MWACTCREGEDEEVLIGKNGADGFADQYDLQTRVKTAESLYPDTRVIGAIYVKETEKFAVWTADGILLVPIDGGADVFVGKDISEGPFDILHVYVHPDDAKKVRVITTRGMCDVNTESQGGEFITPGAFHRFGADGLYEGVAIWKKTHLAFCIGDHDFMTPVAEGAVLLGMCEKRCSFLILEPLDEGRTVKRVVRYDVNMDNLAANPTKTLITRRRISALTPTHAYTVDPVGWSIGMHDLNDCHNDIVIDNDPFVTYLYVAPTWDGKRVIAVIDQPQPPLPHILDTVRFFDHPHKPVDVDVDGLFGDIKNAAKTS